VAEPTKKPGLSNDESRLHSFELSSDDPDDQYPRSKSDYSIPLLIFLIILSISPIFLEYFIDCGGMK